MSLDTIYQIKNTLKCFKQECTQNSGPAEMPNAYDARNAYHA